MKTAFKIIFLTILLTSAFNLKAQESENQNESYLTEQNDSLEFRPTRHIVKLNVPSLAFGVVSFQYEFFPINWLSLNLGMKFTPERKMPFKDQIIDLIGDENDTDDLDEPLNKFFEEFKYKGNSITPEVRFYLGKGYGKGFYLGPFLRFDNYKFNSTYLFQSSLDDYMIDFEGKYKGFGYGLNIGTQFTIGKHFTIDTSLGPYFSNVKVDFNSTSNYTLTDEEVEEFRDDLNDFELPNGETDITLSNSSAKAKLTSDNFFNLRFNLGVGFRF